MIIGKFACKLKEFDFERGGYTPADATLFLYIYTPDFQTDTQTSLKVTHT